MHEFFANWYAQIAPQVDSAHLEARWSAVEALSGKVGLTDAPAFALHSLNLGTPSTGALREAARVADPTFVTSNDTLELRVLAAAVCLNIMGDGSSEAQAIALALLTSSFARNQQDSIIVDLLSTARQTLQDGAEAARENTDAFPVVSAKTIKDALGRLTVGTEVTTLNAYTLASATALGDILVRFSTDARAKFDWLSRLQREDSDVAYLVVSATSIVAGCPYSTLTKAQAAVVAAVDTSQVTRFAPVLATYEAVMATLLRSPKISKKENFTLAVAVNELPATIRNQCTLKIELSPMCMPMLFAFNKCIEVKGQDAWSMAFEAVTGLLVTSEVSSQQLAVQVYRERMLARLVSDDFQ